MPRLFFGLVAALLATLPASSGRAALPVPPDQVAYSGVLVDGGGAPLAGPVDLTARIYDAASGGTLVFVQSFSGVALSDGHYTLNLGPTGAATDSPTNPLTTSLRSALTGNLAAGAGRFVEITVNTDAPLARVALVLVPYAMRADHATTSDVATNALDTQAVGGLDGVALLELFEHYNDEPGGTDSVPATDPREGTADTDGDGEANFVDPDNDNDTHPDYIESQNGWNINLATPWSNTVVPSVGGDNQQTLVTVTGAGFQPGMTAVFGSQTFTPAVTSTTFSVTVGPQPAGVVNLVVTNTNGETSTKTSAFTFSGTTTTTTLPTIPLFSNYPLVASTQLVARGEQLLASGLTSSGSNRGRYSADTIVDSTVAFNVGSAIFGTAPSPTSWNSSRVIYNLRGWATTDQVQLLRDNNGDNLVVTSEAIAVESPGVDPVLQSASLAFDASDRPGGGYLRNVGGVLTAVAFHDRDGNGSFGGANEVVAIEPVTGATTSLGEAAFDPSGRLAYVYYDSGAGRLRAAWDRSGDGDFADTVSGTPELVTVATTATPTCIGAAFDTAGRLAVIYGNTLRRDLSGDGDFDDVGETPPLPAGGSSCDITAAAAGNRLVVVHFEASALKVLCDLNDDGDYTDTDENVTVATNLQGPLAVTESASGAVRVLTQNGVVLGPVR